MWVKLKNGVVERFPYTYTLLCQDHPNTSFPKKMDTSMLESMGVYEVTWLDAPQVDEATKKVVKKDLPEYVNGSWVLDWDVIEKTEDEKAQYTAFVTLNNLEKRNQELASTDWTQLPDAPANASEWAVYRQALRDITTHPNWPNLADTDWPIAPE